MESAEIKQNIEIALNILYRTENELIIRGLHEQTICARLMYHLQHLFPEWHVDVEFNREGEKNTKTRADGEERRPDIVIHRRGPEGPNLAVILAKCERNTEPPEKDIADAIGIKDRHNYQCAFLIEFKSNEPRLTEL